MERPQTHIMRTKVSSCPNHVEAYGPKIANRVSKTRLLFLKTKSLRLDIQLESTWDVGININRAFNCRFIYRVSKTQFPSGCHVENGQLRSDQNMKCKNSLILLMYEKIVFLPLTFIIMNLKLHHECERNEHYSPYFGST